MTEASTKSTSSPGLSVVIMARDEELNIVDCLRSVEFADERIVVDTGSVDDTRVLAAEQGATVIELPWEGYGPTKAKALIHANSEWILSLDADERIPPALAHEILAHIGEPDVNGFELSRRSFFLGREMRHGGWDHDWVLRLVRKGKFKVSLDPVHEQISVDGNVNRLNHPMDHHTNPTFAHYLAKIDLYSTLAAEKIAADRTRAAGPLVGVGHGLSAFVKKYFIQRGFLDGVHGALLAISTAYEKFLRYTKAGLIRSGHRDTVSRVHLKPVTTEKKKS